ncbi:MAG: lycopene cyclase domain-containing protein [Anaerolineales bacterium]
MTYLSFLFYFVLTPAVLFTLLVRPSRREWATLGALVVITCLWTTPWDNYLVGSGVWYYDPQLVSGLLFGWVPLEEYLFFGLQCWMTSLWTLGLMRAFSRKDAKAPRIVGLALAFALPLAFGFSPLLTRSPAPLPALSTRSTDLPPLPFGQWNYLVLILAWALPVIAGQAFLGYGAFRAHWPAFVLGFLVPAVYLTALDSLAIGAGTWTIAPSQSANVFLPGGVPIEEGVFFLVTNIMVAQGWLLFTSPIAHARILALLGRKTKDKGRTPVSA